MFSMKKGEYHIMKKMFKTIACIGTSMLLFCTAYAVVLGKINVKVAYGSNQYNLGEYEFTASGSTEETFADPQDVTNLYARASIINTNGEVVATDFTLDHYVSKVYSRCESDPIEVGREGYYAELYGRARYSDDSTAEKYSTSKTYYYVKDLRSNDENNDSEKPVAEEGFRLIPKDYFYTVEGEEEDEDEDDFQNLLEINSIQLADPMRKVLMSIFGDHYMTLQVGDFLPDGVYVSDDEKSCYVIDKRGDGTQTKTTYSIDRGNYTVEKVEKIK